MSKYLMIVESPAKEKTIAKFLGADFTVKSSYGHIRDLPKSKIGVEIENGFEPKYVLVTRAKKIIPELKKLSKKASKVFLATDYDREGEAIAWHLKEALGVPEDKAKRITFHEITSEALHEAVKHPRTIDPYLVNSQQARRILDRLVGYRLSPLLWRKVKSGLSAGRVQSVAVRLICDREEEIKNFKPQEYWTVEARLQKFAGELKIFSAGLVSKDGSRYDKLDIKDRIQSDAILKDLSGADYEVSGIEQKERKRSPMPPYMTSTMQQDASRRLGFSAAKTMMVAQKLYEGINVGTEGTVGLITYMRTDSLNVSEASKKESRAFIEKRYGHSFLPAKPRLYKSKAKGAQEAHEAIHPTSVKRVPEEIRKYLTPEEFKLYDLIWRRFVASQMTDAVYDTVSVDIKARNYGFRASGRTLKFKGFLEIYALVDDEEEQSADLPALSAGEKLKLIELLPSQHFTEPPPRFNEASLIKALEENGIGRPSTYAPIIFTIKQRNYVRLEQKRFYPTSLGCIVTDILKKHFTHIIDVAFTAVIEKELDLIAEGKEKWTKVLKDFYIPFEEDLREGEKNIKKQKIEPQKTSEICPKCGKHMVIRDSWRGQFLACSGFPDCKTTFSIDKDGNKIVRPDPVVTKVKCEKCGRPMLKRVGKRGPFLACSGFPKCRNIKKYDEKLHG
ncbi:MAG: type I DNA topoisomerase [Endomicrobiales bacterium]|nr:type I DNA topoisomerase [Endomicrobiales bacterium]